MYVDPMKCYEMERVCGAATALRRTRNFAANMSAKLFSSAARVPTSFSDHTWSIAPSWARRNMQSAAQRFVSHFRSLCVAGGVFANGLTMGRNVF